MNAPQFAHNAPGALQCYADLIASSQTLVKYANNPEARKRLIGTTLGFIIQDDVHLQDWLRMIHDVPVYFWSEKTTALVLQASQTYPLDEKETLDEESLTQIGELLKQGVQVAPPTSIPKVWSALAVFERPVLFINVNGSDVPLSALLWRVSMFKQHKEVTLVMKGLEWSGTYCGPCWWSDSSIGDASLPDMNDPDHTFYKEKVRLTKWICTASMFLEQEILSSTPTHVGKYIAKRVPDHEPLCHVISLRKTIQHEHPQTAGESDIEWACRWLVRGHWRNQYFPSTGTRAPIWIHPHVKGPEDKPFRALPTVYSVTK